MTHLAANLQYGILADVFESSLLSSGVLSGITNLYFSLHSANPTDSGNQTSSEVSYTGYSRVAVARSTSGFTASNVNYNVLNDSAIQWPQCTGGTATARYVGIGTASSSTGTLLAYFPITASSDDWMYCVTDQANDELDIYSAHLGTDPVLAVTNEIALAPIYNDTITQGLSGSTVYYIKSSFGIVGTWPAAQSIQLVTASDGSGTAVPITQTLGASETRVFQCIRVTPLSISSGVYPTVNASGFKMYMT